MRVHLCTEHFPLAMTYNSLFPGFPRDAQLWIYTTAQSLDETKCNAFLAQIRAFLSTWKSHGAPVTAAAEILDDRFLVVAAYLESDHVSGCGIDASTRAFDDAARSLDIRWEESLNVLYRTASGAVSSVSRQEFRRLAGSGEIHESVRVFDPSITSLGALRDGAFEMPASESWHARYFRGATAAVS